jgi:hypothetical protein
MGAREFRRIEVPVGRRERVEAVVGSDEGVPATVTLSYGDFLRLAARLKLPADRLVSHPIPIEVPAPEEFGEGFGSADVATPEPVATVIDIHSARRERLRASG